MSRPLPDRHPKGAATRETIVGRAYDIARASGVEGLSIGPLAAAVGMSKSGVFAHFGSREDLRLAVLEEAAPRFGNAVLIPALWQPRGLPRLRAIMHNWFEWVRGTGGGCVLMGSVMEYDDRPAPCTTRSCATNAAGAANCARRADLPSTCGHLADGDVDQYVFELYAIPLTVHHEAGLFGYDTRAPRRRGRRTLDSPPTPPADRTRSIRHGHHPHPELARPFATPCVAFLLRRRVRLGSSIRRDLAPRRRACSPRPSAVAARALGAPTGARPDDILEIDGQRIATYAWGDPTRQPYVLFAHGWSSHGARFAPWVQRLRAEAMPWSRSTRRRTGAALANTTSLPDFACHLLAVGHHFGPAGR